MLLEVADLTIGVIALLGRGRYCLGQTMELSLTRVSLVVALTSLRQGGLRVGEQGRSLDFQVLSAGTYSPGSESACSRALASWSSRKMPFSMAVRSVLVACNSSWNRPCGSITVRKNASGSSPIRRLTSVVTGPSLSKRRAGSSRH